MTPDYSWAHPENPAQSPDLMSLNLITSTMSLLPCKVTYSQVSGIRICHLCNRGIIPPTTHTHRKSLSSKNMVKVNNHFLTLDWTSCKQRQMIPPYEGNCKIRE